MTGKAASWFMKTMGRLFLTGHFLQHQLRLCHQRIIRMIDNESRSAASGLFHMLSLDIVNLDFIIVPAFGVPGGQGSGLFEGAVRQLFALGADYHVGTRNAFGVEPPVIAVGNLEGHFLILVVVLSNIDIKPVGGAVVVRAAGDLRLFRAVRAFLYKAEFHQLFFDLHQIILLQRDIQGGADGFQVVDFLFRLQRQVAQGFIGTFQLVVLGKEFLGIFLGGKLWIQRNLYLLIGVVIQAFQLFLPAF